MRGKRASGRLRAKLLNWWWETNEGCCTLYDCNSIMNNFISVVKNCSMNNLVTMVFKYKINKIKQTLSCPNSHIQLLWCSLIGPVPQTIFGREAKPLRSKITPGCRLKILGYPWEGGRLLTPQQPGSQSTVANKLVAQFHCFMTISAEIPNQENMQQCQCLN